MASFNKVILLGNVTRDPQVKRTPAGQAVTEVGIAVNRYWFDKASNSRREETTFVDVTCWGRDAEIAGEYLSKGRPVMIEGRLQLDSWDDKQTGQKRSKLRVVCEKLQLLGSRDGGGGGGGGGGRGASSAPAGDSYSQSAEEYGAEPSYGGGGFSSGGGEAPQDDVPF